MIYKLFFSIISIVIILPMLSSVYGQIDSQNVLFYDSMVKIIITSIFLGVCIPIGILIYRGRKGKKSKSKKNESKKDSGKPKKEKNPMDTIQERLVKGEISIKEYQELKKELQ